MARTIYTDSETEDIINRLKKNNQDFSLSKFVKNMLNNEIKRVSSESSSKKNNANIHQDRVVNNKPIEVHQDSVVKNQEQTKEILTSTGWLRGKEAEEYLSKLSV